MAKLSWSLKAMTTSILLEDRGVIEVSGTEAGKFLHNLVTNNVTNLSPGQACFAALLSPQGKFKQIFSSSCKQLKAIFWIAQNT